MITVSTNSRCHLYYGFSTDRKPTDECVGNGSLFYEFDTGKLFYYDEEHHKWLFPKEDDTDIADL